MAPDVSLETGEASVSTTSQIEPAHQSLVNAHFDADADRWRQMYTDGSGAAETVGSLVIRERHEAALKWIDRLPLSSSSKALELGSGAGMLSIALARQGLAVTATDASTEMVRLIARNADEAGVSGRLDAAYADAASLQFGDGSFELVVALGVLSWLERPEDGLREMARVVKPGGHVVFSTFNRMQLTALVDPLRNPWVRPVKLKLKRIVERTGLREASTSLAYHDRAFVDGMVAGAGLERLRSKTIGFGPFSLFQKEFLPQETAITVHRRAQQLANLGLPGLRHGGMFYLVLARRPER